jgi:hypothetical protein
VLKGYTICAFCRGEIHEHHQLFDHIDCGPQPPPRRTVPATAEGLKGLDIMRGLFTQVNRSHLRQRRR